MFNASDLGRTRTRVLGVEEPLLLGEYVQYLSGVPFSRQKLGGRSLQGLEVTTDATHPWFVLFQNGKRGDWYNLVRNPFWKYIFKTGGDFKSVKTSLSGGKKVSISTSGANRATYNGWVTPVDPAIVGLAPDPLSDSYLRDLGAKLVFQNRPDQPLVGISQTLAELKREGLPRVRALSSFRSYSPRKGGEDYLSWQFGFRPVIQDIYALADSIDTADKQWRSLVKRAEKLERRHVEFPVERSTKIETVAVGGSTYPSLPATLASGQTTALQRTRTMETSIRFSAAYVYWLPRGSESTIKAVRKVQQYRHQYGLEIDPALLWQLQPWSWLVDWFLPIGDFVSSVSSLYLGNTALPWAFISYHSRVVDTYERPGARLTGGSDFGSLQVVSDYKRRLGAHPLGFGFSWEGLSPKQLSLLAAIGITR